jgi:hypothetical protein
VVLGVFVAVAEGDTGNKHVLSESFRPLVFRTRQFVSAMACRRDAECFGMLHRFVVPYKRLAWAGVARYGGSRPSEQQLALARVARELRGARELHGSLREAAEPSEQLAAHARQ